VASLPTGRLTRKSIVDLACRRAGNTQLAAGPNFDAQTWLNQILYDLAVEWSWPTLMTSIPVAITGPTFPLPADFLKSQDDAGLVLTSVNAGGQRIFLDEVDRYTFEVAQPPTVGSGGFPRIWHADRNAGLARLFPDPSGLTITGLLRYQALPADIPVDTSGDATIPWFPWPWYLVQDLFVRVLEFEADGRAGAERDRANLMLEQVRQAAKPLRAQEPVIPLDPQVFGTPFVRD
jgi:hypothetical protein